MKMIKRILRAALGVVFFFVFFIFLLVGALKFRVLSPTFWKTSLDKGGVYQQLQGQVTKMLADMKTSLIKDNGGRALPPEAMKMLGPFLSIDKLLTAERFKELIETNIDRLFSYLDSNDKELILFLPVTEWKLPVQIFIPALAKLTAHTSLKDALPALGIKPEQVKSVMDQLDQIRILLGYLPIAWIVLLLLVVGIGVAHYFLGVGLADRINGTAWLVMISGFAAALVGFSADKIFESIAVSSKPPLPTWGIELGKSFIGQFFNFGAMIGLVTGVIAIVTIIGVIYLIKQGKIKKEAATMGFVKRFLSFTIGVILGFVILVGPVAGVALMIGGNAGLKATDNSMNVGLKSAPNNKPTKK